MDRRATNLCAVCACVRVSASQGVVGSLAVTQASAGFLQELLRFFEIFIASFTLIFDSKEGK